MQHRRLRKGVALYLGTIQYGLFLSLGGAFWFLAARLTEAPRTGAPGRTPYPTGRASDAPARARRDIGTRAISRGERDGASASECARANAKIPPEANRSSGEETADELR